MAFPKQIVLVRSTYSSIGGVERVALSLIKSLLQKGTRVILLTVPGQQWPISDPNLKIVRVGIQRGYRLIKAWAFNRSVNRYLSHHKNDVVVSLDKVTHFTHLHAGGGTHKSFLKIKSQYASAPARIFQRLSLFHHYILYLERIGFENPVLQKVRCNSQMVMDIIRSDYGVSSEKLLLVPSGIRWQEMEDSFSRRLEVAQALCHENQIDPHWRSLLFLGNNFIHKGLDIAIQGLQALPPEYHLIVVGKGAVPPYRRLASSLGLKERVHFIGPQPKGWRYASFCKALVLPSHYDPFGGASAEGHAMGVPVLISDKTGYADWVIHGENGIILKTPMSADRIHKSFMALKRLIEQPVWTPNQLRQHARCVDDEVVFEQLLEKFF